ncbi:MAG: methionine--tRNA ligase [Bacilli bacterium]|jgi:methionyl-tRNA synthetase|nr:methionine--tRNA ligase [Bacilli bacterium]HHU24655.1 methionine--tRNA ligase [Acholeplasmataceae bacterium]
MAVSSKKPCYVTTPIYYSSGKVHIGNSYTTIACDVFARFNRLMGHDVFFLTGMDEHGQKIEEAAQKAGLTPEVFVEGIAEETKKLWHNLRISNDDFIRTSELRHTKVVQKMFEEMLKNDDIYLGTYSGNYCVSCETYFTKTQLGEDQTCPDCGKQTKIISEEGYFLRLTKYQQKLIDFIEQNPDFIQPEQRKNEVLSFIKSGLEDLCVSRTSFKWGIPVLSNPKHVVYVWIDALSNYLSVLGYGSENESNYQKYWVNSDMVFHVVGKDILRFHAVYWPIMLMALGVPVKFKLIAHGWILIKSGRMSKSRGNAVYPMDLVNRYGLDPVRYYLAKELAHGNDGLFSYERFVERYNNDLANDLGNLLSRTISMIQKYRNGIIPSYQGFVTPYDQGIKELTKTVISEYIENFARFSLPAGIAKVWTLIDRANKYIDETEPWKLAKDESNKAVLDSVLYHLAEILRISGVLVSPILVEAAPKIQAALGIKEPMPQLESLEFGYTFTGLVESLSEPLFKRVKLEEELAYFNEDNQENETTPLKEQAIVTEEPKEEHKPIVTIDDFAKLDLRVGEIIDSKKHPNATKLLVSQVKIGEEVRQIVSGIAEYYQPEEIIGKKVLVVVNLKPVKIRGEMSNGMLLCAEEGDKLELLESKMPSGSSIK